MRNLESELIGASGQDQAASTACTAEIKFAPTQARGTAADTAKDEWHAIASTEKNKALSTPVESLILSTMHESPVRCAPDASHVESCTAADEYRRSTNTEATQASTTTNEFLKSGTKSATVVNIAACGNDYGRGLCDPASGFQESYFAGSAYTGGCEDGQDSGWIDETAGQRLTSPFPQAALAASSPFQQHSSAAGEAAVGTPDASTAQCWSPTTEAAAATVQQVHSSVPAGDTMFKKNAACDQHVSSKHCSGGGGNGAVHEVDDRAISSTDEFDSESTSEESGSSETDDCDPEMDGRKTDRIIRKLSRMLSSIGDTLLTTTSSRKVSHPLPPCLSPEDLRDPPDAEDFHNWPDTPVLLRPSANAAPYQVISASTKYDLQRQRVRGNCLEGIDFSTPLFKGKLLLMMDGLASTPPGVFDGKKRRTWMVVQGKFQREVSFDDLLSGQEFERRLENLPANWFVDKVLLQLARRVNSSMIVGPLSQPSMMSPVASLAQIINVSPEGSAPDPFSAEEDMRLFDPELVDANGAPMGSNLRRKFFSSPKNRSGRQFDTEHVWTFHVWQQFVDMSKYQLDLGITKYSLTRHLAGQPLQFSFKDKSSGSYVFSFDICHECLLQGA